MRIGLTGDATLPPSTAGPDDLAALLYTSGSTGLPKGVMLSHANLWLGAISVAHFLGLSADDRTLAVLPLAFDYGQNQLLSTWAAGGHVIAFDYLLPRDVVRAVGRHDVTVLAGVPPLWLQLAEADWSGGEGASLRTLTNSGGHLPLPVVRKLRALFPDAQLHLMYGLTEAFRSTSLDPDSGRCASGQRRYRQSHSPRLWWFARTAARPRRARRASWSMRGRWSHMAIGTILSAPPSVSADGGAVWSGDAVVIAARTGWSASAGATMR